MSTTSTTLQASAVSRKLRAGGLRPLPSGTPRSREGVRVSQTPGHVSVLADVNAPSLAVVLADTAFAILAAANYRVERISDTLLWVYEARS